MTTQILEGAWEEITRHANQFAGHRVRVTVLDEESQPTPNAKALEVISSVAERNKNMPVTSGEGTLAILREGRAGRMFYKVLGSTTTMPENLLRCATLKVKICETLYVSIEATSLVS